MRIMSHELSLILAQGFGEVIREAVHRLGRDFGQDQRGDLACQGTARATIG